MKKFNLIAVHSLPFVFGIALSYLFWRNNLILLICYLLIVTVFILAGKDRKTELGIAVYGFVAALIIESLGSSVSHYQTFNNPTFWGIPIWLPVAFSYGFILMKRIGFILSKGSPWHS